jgi:hypothetical protein
MSSLFSAVKNMVGSLSRWIGWGAGLEYRPMKYHVDKII